MPSYAYNKTIIFDRFAVSQLKIDTSVINFEIQE